MPIFGSFQFCFCCFYDCLSRRLSAHLCTHQYLSCFQFYLNCYRRLISKIQFSLIKHLQTSYIKCCLCVGILLQPQNKRPRRVRLCYYIFPTLFWPCYPCEVHFILRDIRFLINQLSAWFLLLEWKETSSVWTSQWLESDISPPWMTASPKQLQEVCEDSAVPRSVWNQKQ